MFANTMLYFCLDHLTECSIHALGMENNLLPNSAITASSVWPHPGSGPWLARLNNVQLSACPGAPGQRHRMKLASGYKLISGRRG